MIVELVILHYLLITIKRIWKQRYLLLEVIFPENFHCQLTSVKLVRLV